jgi:signal transduction histidine kinase
VARLDALATASRQAAQQMSDVVWGLDAQHLRLSQLLARMRDHAQELLPPAGLDVRFHVPADLPDPELAPTLGHNLYLIYKEALHNVVKHARATTVTVQLVATAGLTLTVADDGCGHDGQPRPGGHGLANMQARAQAVGGTVHYEAMPTGFAVVVGLPLG